MRRSIWKLILCNPTRPALRLGLNVVHQIENFKTPVAPDDLAYFDMNQGPPVRRLGVDASSRGDAATSPTGPVGIGQLPDRAAMASCRQASGSIQARFFHRPEPSAMAPPGISPLHQLAPSVDGPQNRPGFDVCHSPISQQVVVTCARLCKLAVAK